MKCPGSSMHSQLHAASALLLGFYDACSNHNLLVCDAAFRDCMKQFSHQVPSSQAFASLWNALAPPRTADCLQPAPFVSGMLPFCFIMQTANKLCRRGNASKVESKQLLKPSCTISQLSIQNAIATYIPGHEPRNTCRTSKSTDLCRWVGSQLEPGSKVGIM